VTPPKRPRRPKKAAAAATPQPQATVLDAGVRAVPAGPESTPVAAEESRAEQATPIKRVWVTGGAGFIGRAVVRTLLGRGYEVTAAVRDPKRAAFLTELGATLVEDDLSDVPRTADALRGSDAVIHVAGRYRTGITKAQRGPMWDANIGTTTRMLDAAEAATIKRIVYVSTVNVFGNTHGKIVDESYQRDLGEGFLTWYDETKYGAHEVALQRLAGGAPIVIAMPSQAIGPGDYSEYGEQLRLAHDGKLPYVAAASMGIAPAHVDDIGQGIVAVLEGGEIGRSYILAGECIRHVDGLEMAAAAGGRRLPRLRLPDGLVRAMVPVGPLLGFANASETASASLGVTYWASPKRAEDELGWTRRGAADAIADTLRTS
jgi:dihydroflavonol-4-reductase